MGVSNSNRSKNKRGGELCIDMRIPNQAVIRERNPLLTLQEILQEFSGPKYFLT